MRRDPLEIMEKIMLTLEKQHACTMNELAQRTQLHYLTVRRYVRIIELVRREPDVEIIKTRHSIIIRMRGGQEKE